MKSLTTGRLLLAYALMTPLSACARRGGCKTVEVDVVGDHSHTVHIAADKVKQGVGGTYRVHGEGHDHAFRLSDADMQKLERGESVAARTTSSNAHLHELSVRCGH
jgi:hypothetical protein